MSAIPHVQERVIVDRRPMPRVQEQPKARVKVRVRSRGLRWVDVIRFSAYVAVGMTVLHFVGGFTAQLLIEQSRRAAIASEQRAAKAEQEAAGIRAQIEGLAGSDRIEAWAALNGFNASYLAINEAPR